VVEVKSSETNLVENDARLTCYGCADKQSAGPEGGLEVEEEERQPGQA
jgi:hypothetical protein